MKTFDVLEMQSGTGDVQWVIVVADNGETSHRYSAARCFHPRRKPRQKHFASPLRRMIGPDSTSSE